MHRYIVRAGISTGGSCHLFRHSMATAMLDHGADIRFVQEMLGHRRLETTQIYTHVSIEKLKAVHRTTHPAERFAAGAALAAKRSASCFCFAFVVPTGWRCGERPETLRCQQERFPMSDSEREIQALEDQFPPLSGPAFAAARETVLASGQSVLQSENGHIYRVFPDGRRERVKPVAPPTAVKPGTRLAIR